MALQVITIADSNGTPRNVVVSDSVPGPDNYINAFVPVTTGAEVDTGNPLPVTAVVSSLPSVTVASLPSVTVSSLPSVTIASMPSVTVATMPSVTVASIPSITVGTALPAGTNVIGKFGIQVGGSDLSSSNPVPVMGKIVRPFSGMQIASNSTQPYSAGNLMANNGTGASVIPLSWNVGRSSGFIRRVMLTSNRNTAVANTPVLRLHIWTATPTFTNGDRQAFLATGATAASATYLGAFDFGTSRGFSDGYVFISGQPLDGFEQNFVIGSGTTLYGALTVSPNSPSPYTPYHTSTLEIWYAYLEVHLF